MIFRSQRSACNSLVPLLILVALSVSLLPDSFGIVKPGDSWKVCNMAPSTFSASNTDCFDIPTQTALNSIVNGNASEALDILKNTQDKLSSLNKGELKSTNSTSMINYFRSNLAESIDALQKGNSTEAADILQKTQKLNR